MCSASVYLNDLIDDGVTLRLEVEAITNVIHGVVSALHFA